MGAIAVKIGGVTNEYISIPAMGGAIADKDLLSTSARVSIPAMGGQ